MAIDGQTTQLQMLDTAGEEALSCMIHQSIIAGNGFVLVYSITDRDSFLSMEQYYTQVIQIKETNQVGIVMIANKADQDHNREVSVEEGTKLAKRLGVPFFETSAKTRKELTQAFCGAVREVQKFDVAISSSPVTSPRTPKKKEKVEKVVIVDDAAAADNFIAVSPKKTSSGGGCLSIFRKRSKSESAKPSPALVKEKDIVVAHM
jgi:small GTP-binding protein